MTLAQAAAYANVPKRTIQHAAKKGYLESTQIADNFYVTTQEAVDRWLASDKKRASRKR
ncbi:MAG: helix-turn-helix domain-containing protein [Bryobacterales bacterium]|nr:helix-turn-helix domain-containing protein [Bryobacterales bacterium]